jgi:diacylglycerol kinase (ATP)
MPLIVDLPPDNPAIIFVNGAAGRGEIERFILPEMRLLVAAKRWPVEFEMTQSAKDLETCIQRALESGSRVLMTMGGDGTFNLLINVVMNAGAAGEVVFGVIPTGGGNDFAASLGMPRNPLLALEKIVHGEPVLVDLALASVAARGERYFAAGSGVGLDAKAAELASRDYRHLRGRTRYVIAALHAYAKFQAITVKVEFPDGDHADVNTKVMLASVMNTATYGGGVRLAPGAKIDDGLLDVILVENLKMMKIAALLPRLLWSGELRIGGITQIRTRRVRLTTDCASFFQGDGEILGSAPVEVRVIANAIKVLVPVGR